MDAASTRITSARPANAYFSRKMVRSCRSVILFLVIICGAVAVARVGYVSADDHNAGMQTVTYSHDVHPVLERHCIECHSGWFPDGGLRLDTIEGVLKGGNSGPAIVPGSPDKGWLMYSLTEAGQRRMKMPPNSDPLSQQEVDIIRKWIKQGAR